jgi:hypothetical protein
MGELINLNDFRCKWREVLSVNSDNSTLVVYVDEKSGNAEIVQINDEGDAILTALSAIDRDLLSAALSLKNSKKGTTK